MVGVVRRAATGLRSRSAWLSIITCTLGIVANAVSECVGSQILQTVPALAAMGGDELGLGAITMELGANTLGTLLIVALCVLWNLPARLSSSFRGAVQYPSKLSLTA